MLQPKKHKWRKPMLKDLKEGNDIKGSSFAFGSFALKAMEAVYLTDKQIEASRVALTRHMKREGQVWIRIFPDRVLTRKAAEVRMGKGKGNPEGWVSAIRPGRIIFEVDGVSMQTAKESLDLAAQKLPIKTKFSIRRDYQA